MLIFCGTSIVEALSAITLIGSRPTYAHLLLLASARVRCWTSIATGQLQAESEIQMSFIISFWSFMGLP
jgi:hypothetical protein